jgi:hypothetical protein
MSHKGSEVKRPSAERAFSLKSASDEDVDYYALLSLLFGILGLFLKVILQYFGN